MRLGIDARTLSDHFPGVGRYVHHLVQGLAASLGEADRLFVLVDAGHRQSRFDLGGPAQDRCTEMLAGGSPFSFRAPREARRWVASRRLEVLHAPYFLGVRRVACPTVLTWHDAIPLSHPASMPSFWRRRAFRASAASALRRAERVVTPSRASRNELIRLLGTPAERVDVVPHAAAESFRPLPRKRSAAAVERLGLRPPYVLCVAGPRPHKNLEGLLDAWRALPAELVRDRTLVLVGPDDERFPAPRRRYEELARKRRLAWLPNLEERDLPALYSAADVYVQPSFAEGFGLPVIEAMACGTAVACADVDGLRETVGDASNAELFAPESSESIAHCLAGLLSDPERRRRVAERGRQHAGEPGWRKTAERMLEIYRQAAKRA